jgi:RNA polymerase sigma-70 factor (sigma-E family)
MTEEDETAFDEFLAARSTALLRTAILVCGASAADAEDLVQSALEKVYRHWPRIRHDNPGAYARRVVVNTAISAARRKRILREITFARLPDTPARGHDLDLREVLMAELRRLPARMRAVVVLRYWEDLSEAETAALLGCSTGTVKSQAARGLARIRERMDGREALVWNGMETATATGGDAGGSIR